MTAPTTVATATPTVHANYGDTLTKAQRLTYVLMLGALVALGPFTIDLYLPAFPSVASDLATSAAAIQLTLTATTVGFGLGQLIVGPLSDAMGRRRPLLIATSVHIVASVGVAMAPSVEWVMAGRVVQGMGAAGGAVVAMAVVRDLFGGQRLIRMLSRLALVMGFAPVFAPVIGSQLLRFVEWRGVFVFLAAYGLIVTAVAGFILVETLPHERRGRFSSATVARRYRRLVKDPAFIGIAVVGAATFTALFAYLSASSFIFQDVFGLTAQQFGLVFGLNSIGLVAGTQISARLMRHVAPRVVTAGGLGIMTAGALGLLVSSLLDAGLLGVVIPLFFVIAPAGLVMPTVQVMALADHATEAGTAASLIGAANMGIAGAVSPLVGIGGNSPTAMAVVMLGALMVGQASLWLVVRGRTTNEVMA
ncbi:multidrug effflux MFS transporter [Demequina sp. TTPB684]|uniref:multidrug effflux MFS transporter n=1 Tax=unclassified Demequina TaxID=2620311 RepID=UPI001CF10E3C|nr:MULTISPECIES: multidrug effflux MFS transporter [unclassified Demequina]MCB2412623.1 multidrug effflux MFS transporter [Demequina sp. TTPB684]UPU88230.1 multidrug effflux MFS transporter [Demequina sp. TMPB413]